MPDERHVVTCAALRGAKAAAVSGLEADLAFCHPSIRGVGGVDPAAGTVELRTTELDAASKVDLEKQVAAVVERSVRSYRFVDPTPPLWRHDAAARYVGGRAALDRFVEKYTRRTGPGQTAYIGPAARLREWIDSRARALATSLGGEPWHLPNIEMVDDFLEKTGYFHSHPQLVTYGYRLPPHFEKVERFAAAAKKALPAGPSELADLEPAGFILEPAVCHNIFRALRGERIPAGRVITSVGCCYRYEGFRFQPLLRQWEYSVREVVFAGAPAWVEEKRLALVELAKSLVTELDIDAALEVATDPFFVSEAASARAFQLMGSTKIELRVHIDEGVGTAASSFNRHGKHFSDPMDMRPADGDEPVDTACAGFGLERWMAAFIARWGADPEKWPISGLGA
jgi:seryl-tRNA synthetase